MRARRGRGEGSVYERKDGKWVVSISLGYDVRGRRRRKEVLVKTKGEALAALRRLQTKTLVGQNIEPSRMTLGSFMEDWLSRTVKPKARANTFASYETTTRVHVMPTLGGMRLTGIKPAHLTAFYSELEGRGVSGRTRENVHLVLSLALKQAMRWGYIENNPAALVDRPKREPADVRAWTREEAITFLDHAKDNRMWPLYLLAITTGMRQGELFGLRWEDIDLERAQLRVLRSLEEVRGVLTEGPPKTKAGRRVIDLPGVAVDALRAHAVRMREEGNGGSAYVFCSAEGAPLRKSNLRQRNLAPLLRSAGVPKITFHALRHTCATLLLEDGVNIRVLQERLGHADVSVTLGVYSHVMPNARRDAANRFDMLLSSSQSPAKEGRPEENKGARPPTARPNRQRSRSHRRPGERSKKA